MTPIAPTATLSNGLIEAVLCLPDLGRGYYRSTRFDWSGMVSRLTVHGRPICGPWFTRRESGVRDFAYRDGEIVVGDESGAAGPAEEFPAPQGYVTAAPGGTFVKIGVGLLRRPDDQPYSPFASYDLIDPGQWTSEVSRSAVAFEQQLGSPGADHAYLYRKVIRLEPDRPVFTIAHELENLGRLPIEATQYNHNFLTFDGMPAAEGLSIEFPFEPRWDHPPDPALAAITGRRVVYRRALRDRERVAFALEGFGSAVGDHDIRIAHPAVGVVRITGDRSLVRLYLWSIRSVVSIEPFVDVATAPGAVTSWTRRYEFS